MALALVAGVGHARPPSAGFMFKNAQGQHVVSARGTEVPRGVPCLSIIGSTSNSESGSGDPANTVVELNIGAGNALTGIAVDATVTANSPSWLSEAGILFSSTTPDDPNAITYTPIFDTDEPGTANASTDGVVLFASIPLADITVAADGILRLEWFEGFDDTEVTPDAMWTAAATPVVCQGVRLICTNQSACDGTVPVELQQFSVD